jgi:hypothetical protein
LGLGPEPVRAARLDACLPGRFVDPTGAKVAGRGLNRGSILRQLDERSAIARALLRVRRSRSQRRLISTALGYTSRNRQDLWIGSSR